MTTAPKPSASPMTPNAAVIAGAAPCSASFVDFNINDYVQVKLTPYGRACLQKNYDELNAAYGNRLPFKHSPPTEDKYGWSRWQVWSLMADLGKHISIGMNPPFETTIRVEFKMPNAELCESAGREKASASGEAQCAPSDSQQ